jgi:hypothetical protein
MEKKKTIERKNALIKLVFELNFLKKHKEKTRQMLNLPRLFCFKKLKYEGFSTRHLVHISVPFFEYSPGEMPK